MDFARTWAVLAAALLGLCLFTPACDRDDSDGTAGEPGFARARQAEEILIKRLAIAPGALVCFVGPMQPGSALQPVADTLQGIATPAEPGDHYLFFINETPDQRYAHRVRYAWVELNQGGFGVVPNDWWPRVVVPGQTEQEPFQLIFSDTKYRVAFYYGSGGTDENGLPLTFLPDHTDP